MPEIIPEIEKTGSRLRVIGPVDRRTAHIGEHRWHPTTLIAVCDTDGLYALVDKYPKNLKKAQIGGYPPPPFGVRLDTFGGHIKFDSLSAEDLAHGLSLQTFDACALEELSEEVLVNGSPLSPDPARLERLGLCEPPGEREISMVYRYTLPAGACVTSQDDALLPNGTRIQIPLPVHWKRLDGLEDEVLCSGLKGALPLLLAE